MSRLLAQPFVQEQIKENIKTSLHHWHLWGEPASDSPHKGPVRQKMFPFDDVIMEWMILLQAMMMSWHGNNVHITDPVTSGFPSQRASNVELCCFLCLLLVTVQSEVNTGWKRAPDYLRLYLANQPWACMNRWHHCRTSHDDYVMTWKHLALLMTLCEGIPLMKCQECGTLIFSLLLVWISCSTNNHVPADLRHLNTYVMSM